MKRSGIFSLCASALALLLMSRPVFGQWAFNGTHIYNTNSGNVGIGTSNPGAKLSVNANRAVFEGTSILGGYGASAYAMELQATGTSGNVYLGLVGGINGSNAQITYLVTAPQFGYTGIHSTQIGTASFLPFTISVGGAERLRIATNGNIGIGTTSPGTRLHVAGTTRTNIVEITGGTDLAESFEIANSESIKPGMVVCIDPEQPGRLKIANKAYDRTVAGIISGAGGINSGITLKKSDAETAGEYPVALTGRVYCWADASNGPIQPGDLLTTSELPGHAMKVTDYTKAQGAILGKAMSTLKKGRGLVLILVTLQ
jgi:hypothetical protein